jgi:hypothetical protein
MQFFSSVKKRGPFVALKAFAADAALFHTVESGARKSFKRWVNVARRLCEAIIL